MIITYKDGFEVVDTLGNPTLTRAITQAKKDCVQWGGKYMAYTYDKKTNILSYIRLVSYSHMLEFSKNFKTSDTYKIIRLPIDK